MRVLVVYASAGAGHSKAAQAIYNCFKENFKQIDVELVDALEKTSPFFRLSYRNGYSFLINKAIFLWAFAFWLTHAKPLRKLTRGVAQIINYINSKGFIDFLLRNNPDFIISTHFLTSEIAAVLKKSKKIKSQVATVITDYGLHPFWVSDGTDTYIVASDFSKKELVSEGIDEKNIKNLGIPIDAKFLKEYDKALLRERLGIDKKRFTALVVTGSFGIGPIEELAELMHKEVQLIIVCANNKSLFKRLKDKNYPNCVVFGFVDNIQELMSAADIIVTKPGGMTISEALAIGIVPIFISAIPGQEVENVRFLERFGIGKSSKSVEKIRKIVLDYKDNPEKFLEIKKKISCISKPNAALEICNVVCKDSFGHSG